MGVALTPLIVKTEPGPSELAGRRLVVDGNGELHQFLALIRLRDGTPLGDSAGRVTSHLVGLFYRTTRLIAEHGLELVFVFDGTPPDLKRAEIDRRRALRARYESERQAALDAGDLAVARSKATMTGRLTAAMIDEARQLLHALGIPVVQAPSEGEAQAAFMASRGDAWATASKDYDTLLFGTPRLLRFLAVSGREFLPSQGRFRPVPPELITLDILLDTLSLTREQLIDLAILVGTDFNDGIKGIGPRKAHALVRRYESIDAMPGEIRAGVPGYEAIRAFYQAPPVSTDYDLTRGQPNEAEVIRLLCDEHEFNRDRVLNALARCNRGSGTLPRE